MCLVFTLSPRVNMSSVSLSDLFCCVRSISSDWWGYGPANSKARAI